MARLSETTCEWIERIARFGYAAKGVVYLFIGTLSFLAAVDARGQAAGSDGAFRSVLGQPYGTPLLVAIAVGLVGYAVWRAVQAYFDTEGKGSDAKGLVMRAGYAGSALIHIGLALSAAGLAYGFSGGDSERSMQDWTSWLMARTWGLWLVGIAGLVALGVAGYQVYKAYSEKFTRELMTDRMSRTTVRNTIFAGKVGLTARGVAIATIGLFLLIAVVQYQPSEVRGLAGALRTLEQQPFGPWLLGAVALGLALYGIYQLILAWYRRVDVRSARFSLGDRRRDAAA
jgi:hypothetical protein